MPRIPDSEFTEVVAGTPELLFGAVKDHHDWVPKMMPGLLTTGARHEGDGHAGSVVHYDVHEDKHDAHGGASSVKVIMEEYNPATLSYVSDYQGDPRYTHLKYCVRFLPGPSPNTTSVKWFIDYTPASDNTSPPDDHVALSMIQNAFKDLAAHLEADKPGNQ